MHTIQFHNGTIIHESLFRRAVPSFAMVKTRDLVFASETGEPGVYVRTEVGLKAKWTAYYIGDDEDGTVVDADLGENEPLMVGSFDQTLEEFFLELVSTDAKKAKPLWTERHVAWAKNRTQNVIDLHNAINDAGVAAPEADDSPENGDAVPAGMSLQDKLDAKIRTITTQMGDGSEEKDGYHLLGEIQGEWTSKLQELAGWLVKRGFAVDINELIQSPIY